MNIKRLASPLVLLGHWIVPIIFLILLYLAVSGFSSRVEGALLYLCCFILIQILLGNILVFGGMTGSILRYLAITNIGAVFIPLVLFQYLLFVSINYCLSCSRGDMNWIIALTSLTAINLGFCIARLAFRVFQHRFVQKQ